MLLLDEPFGALDAKVRKELRRWLRRLHDELHVTSVFVTHDQEEALEVADRGGAGGSREQGGGRLEVGGLQPAGHLFRVLGGEDQVHRGRPQGGGALRGGAESAARNGEGGEREGPPGRRGARAGGGPPHPRGERHRGRWGEALVRRTLPPPGEGGAKSPSAWERKAPP